MSNSCQNFLPHYIIFCPFTAKHKYPLKYIPIETNRVYILRSCEAQFLCSNKMHLHLHSLHKVDTV